MLDFSYNLLVFSFELFLVLQLWLGVFFVGQLVIERFLLITVPIVAGIWDRIRNPYKYQDDKR